VVTRNLSSGGLSFLNSGFLHNGTQCDLQLVTVENSWVDVQATVVRCRLCAGNLHEISVKFDKPVDERQFVSAELGAKILLVDDANDQLRMIGHFLSKAGAGVTTASDGETALKLVAEQDFDLVLLCPRVVHRGDALRPGRQGRRPAALHAPERQAQRGEG